MLEVASVGRPGNLGTCNYSLFGIYTNSLVHMKRVNGDRMYS